MRKATLKSLMAHKLRLALTALSIVLGVGFVAGTYVLTDTINGTFDKLFNTVTSGTDVTVRTLSDFQSQGGPSLRDPVPASLATQIQAVDGVKDVQGSVQGYAQFIGKDGKPVTTQAPTFGQSIGPVAALNGSAVAREGRFPSGPDEVAVDARTAKKQGFAIGDRVKILFEGPPRTFTVVGIMGFGEVDNLAGATFAGFDIPTAQEVLNRKDQYDSIDVVADDGVSQTQLRERIAAVLDPKYEAITGESLADELNQSIKGFTGVLSTAMLAFAGVALFVGAFIIYNTFSIIVAQRTRELALLRCLGASRRQVLGSVLVEALAVAVFASLIGIAFGLVIAILLRGAFDAFGIDLPGGATTILPRTIIVSLLVGIVVTLASALFPARKATKVPPVAAMREEAVGPPQRSIRRRTIVGTLITAVGVATLLAGLFADVSNQVALVGLGAAVTLMGVAALSPLFARPLARVIGWPMAHLLRVPGRLARANAMRNPRRTAATAAALMIGLALVAFVGIFAASLKASTDEVFDRAISADYQLTSTNFAPFSSDLAKRLAGQPELAQVLPARLGPWKLNGKDMSLGAADPVVFPQLVQSDVRSGRIEDLASGGVAVYIDQAKAHNWTVGSMIPMELPRGGVRQVPVKAIYADKTVTSLDYLISLADYEKGYPNQGDLIVLIKAAPGVSPADSRAAIERVANDFPNVKVQDQAQAKADQAKQLDQILGLISVLLGLAIVIALIGIVNTLALSIYERIRELGLLRAVGMERRQVRSMIRWESVIIAVLGAVLGLVVGTFFGWAMVRALRDVGATKFALPVGQLVVFVLLAGLAGILAAVLPARRAARIDVLRALASE
jgi:putative ABC transport system permease protein